MARVVITGWSQGFKASTCTQLLRSCAGLPAAEAQRVTERVLNGNEQVVVARSEADAHLLVAALGKIGASARFEIDQARDAV